MINSFNQDKPHDRFLREQIAGDEISPYSDENLIATGFLAAARLNSNEEDKSIQRNEPLVDLANATASVTVGLTLNCAQCHDHKFDPLTIRDYYRFQGYFIKGQMNNLLLKDPEMWKAYEASIPPELETAKRLRSQIYDPVRVRLAAEAKQKLSPESLAALNTPADQRTPEQIELAKKAEKELSIPKDKVEKALSEDDQKLFKELDKKISTTEKQLDERKPQAWAFYSPATSPHKIDALPPRGMYPLPYEPQRLKETKPHLLKRGDVHRPGDELEPGVPEMLLASHPSPQSAPLEEERKTGLSQHGEAPREKSPLSPSEGEGDRVRGSRSALVDWLTSPTNPLTARVWVNYIWQQHFGRGVVATCGDFGTQGARPTHPELLDWLATELIRSGWSTKHIHRLIVLSNTYRQASQPDPDNAKIDPENNFLWRWSPRRLEAEAIRDRILVVSGELDPTVGGESIPPEAESKKLLRRALYLRQKRHDFPVMQALFDSPTANESCPSRHVSTVSLQPLYMLNSEFLVKRAEAFAARVFDKAGVDQSKQIEIAFAFVFGRTPDETELDAARALLAGKRQQPTGPIPVQPASGTNKSTEAHMKGPPLPLIQFCHALFNLNEFVYLE